MERVHSGTSGSDGRIIIRLFFKNWEVNVWTGLIWLRKRTDGGHL